MSRPTPIEPGMRFGYDHTDPSALMDERGRLYSTDPARYQPRCRSCHRYYDLAAAAARNHKHEQKKEQHA